MHLGQEGYIYTYKIGVFRVVAARSVIGCAWRTYWLGRRLGETMVEMHRVCPNKGRGGRQISGINVLATGMLG